jgi:hypothetical protein
MYANVTQEQAAHVPARSEQGLLWASRRRLKTQKETSMARVPQQSTSTKKPPPFGSAQEGTSASPNASDESRQEEIARGAYYRAEARGFAPGYELEDWLEAERELNERMGAGGIG